MKSRSTTPPLHVHVDESTPVHVHIKKGQKTPPSAKTQVRRGSRALPPCEAKMSVCFVAAPRLSVASFTPSVAAAA